MPQAGLAEMAGGRNYGQVLPQGPPQNQADHYGPPPPLAQLATPVPPVGLADIHAQVEEVIRNTFGTEARPAIRPVFRSPCPANIDTKYLCPINWKMPKFDQSSGEENENTVEHIARFTTQCREAATSPFLKMRLFSTSLTRTAFSWYASLPHNSVHDWNELEAKFHEQFYRAVPELSVTDIASYQQNAGETVEEYLNRFKTAINRCFVRMPLSEFAKIAFNAPFQDARSL